MLSKRHILHSCVHPLQNYPLIEEGQEKSESDSKYKNRINTCNIVELQYHGYHQTAKSTVK